MTKIKVSNIQKLRDLTGAGVMESKRALEECKGDLDAATEWIKERGLEKIEKRSTRETGAGMIISYNHNERIGVILDVRAETDFVVRSDPFKNMAHELVMQIAAMNPKNVKELLEQPYIKDDSKIVQDLLNDVRNRVGENIKINQFYRLEI